MIIKKRWCGSPEKIQALENEFQRSLDRHEITFVANHGGGYPNCLQSLNKSEIICKLREVGFEIREEDICIVVEEWAVDITTGISICLSDGFAIN